MSEDTSESRQQEKQEQSETLQDGDTRQSGTLDTGNNNSDAQKGRIQKDEKDTTSDDRDHDRKEDTVNGDNKNKTEDTSKGDNKNITEDTSKGDSKNTQNGDHPSMRRELREATTYIPNKADTQRECACSDQDYVRLIASDSSVLCKTINRWQQSYQLDVNDLKEKALRLIKGDFRDLYGDLDPEEQEKIEREIARLQRERTELLMGAIGRLAASKENTLNV